jgi:hypothetical protein
VSFCALGFGQVYARKSNLRSKSRAQINILIEELILRPDICLSRLSGSWLAAQADKAERAMTMPVPMKSARSNAHRSNEAD